MPLPQPVTRGLSGRENRPEWAHIWERLTALGEKDHLPNAITLDALATAGHTWLSGRENRPEWAHIWERLTALGEKDRLPDAITLDALRMLALAWLPGREARDDWSFVWERLAKRPTGACTAETLFAQLEPWAVSKQNMQRGEWDKLIEIALDLHCMKPEIITAAAQWCLEHRDAPQMPILAVKVLSAMPNHPQLDQLAEWLSLHVRQEQTDYAVRFAWRQFGPQNLSNSEHGGWTHLRRALSDWRRFQRKGYNMIELGAKYDGTITAITRDRVFVSVRVEDGITISGVLEARPGDQSPTRSFQQNQRVSVVAISVVPEKMRATFIHVES